MSIHEPSSTSSNPVVVQRFLTPEALLPSLGVINPRTLTRWAREGYIPAIPIGECKRRLWRFLQSDLEAWMISRRAVTA